MTAEPLHRVPDRTAGPLAGPADAPGDQESLAERLERGQVLLFPPGRLELPPEEDLCFLRDELGTLMTLKNISYHPRGDYLSGIGGAPAARERARSILRAHNETVAAFLAPLLPEYAGGWRRGKVNYRPLQERGRALSKHSSNERVHVDAFASGATHGDRVLRFFTNVHPEEPRVWRSAGLFPELYREFGAAAGIDGLGPRGLDSGLGGRAFSGALRLMARAGLEQALTVDTSPYDRAMRRLHNHLKDDEAFQADTSRCVQMTFPPLSSWVVLTDFVSHACVSGQHAIVNTWYVDLGHCALPELAPYHVMAESAAPKAGAPA